MDNYVIIVGAMKSGTTTLFSLLADHPQIAPARPKEPGFFAFDEIHAQGWDWYHELFDFDPARHVYRLEASTDYTKEPFVTGVWERMKARSGARYKLIYIMRHPLRRIESHARHVERARKEIGQHIAPREAHGLDNGVSLPSLAMTLYARQLDAFAEARTAGDLYLMTLEELEQTPEKVLPELWDFLGLPPQPVAAPERRNAAEGRRELSESWMRLIRYPALMAAGKKVLSPEQRARIKARFYRTAVVEGRFDLNRAEEETLIAALRDDLARLSRDYGVETERLWGIAP